MKGVNAAKLATGFALVAALSGCGVVEYSEGYRDGEVTKFSQKGIIFKSSEGELAMSNISKSGAVSNNNGGLSNSFAFSVRNDDVAKQLKELAPGTQVRLEYKQVLFPAPWLQDTEYLITKVTVAKAEAEKKEEPKVDAPLVVPKQPAAAANKP